MTIALRSTLLVFAALVWLGTGATAQEERPDQPRLSVVGQGEVQATPDMAVLTLGVVTEAETAREALVANTERMSEIAAALRQAGIEGRDLQTSGFTIEPRFTRPRPPEERGEAETPEIIGYTVRNTLTVRIRNIAEAGALLDEAVTLGSNYVTGLSFTIADPKPLEAEARRAAVADAREKATLYAEAAEIALGPVLLIEEREDFGGPRPVMARTMAAESADVPIEAGEITFRAQVRMDWALGE